MRRVLLAAVILSCASIFDSWACANLRNFANGNDISASRKTSQGLSCLAATSIAKKMVYAHQKETT